MPPRCKPVLNDLKEDELTARYMGKPVWWIAGIILIMPLATAGDTFVQETTEGQVWVNCEDSWSSVFDEQGSIIENDSDYQTQLSSGNHTFHFGDINSCQWVIPVNEELPNNRPAPSQEFTSLNSTICSQMDLKNSNCQGILVSGDLTNDAADIFAIDVESNQIVSLSLLAASSAIDIDIHFQDNNSELKLEQEISLPLNTSVDGDYELIIPIIDDGRLIVSVSSPNPNTLWMLNTEIYQTAVVYQISELDYLMGIGNSTYFYTLGDDESLKVDSSQNQKNGEHVEIKYRYAFTESTFSEWNSATTGDRINAIDSIERIELHWDCDCRWSASLTKSTHFDASWGMDAPGFKPLSSSSDNSTYPLIEMDGHAEDGELTLHMGDYQDILRVETTGWNESVHLVDVVVEGDIYELQVSIWNMDQETWDIIDQKSATYSMDKIRVSLDVGLGTHFIHIQHLNGSDAIDENSESMEWRVRITTAVLDEGEEPWFPASDAVKDAADVFYWLIGFILILPFIIFYINVNKSKRFAEEFARKKNRLQWLSEKLDDGSYSPTDLTKALRSVSTLEWEEALEVWGEPEVRHYTTGIDLAVWTLDRRVADSSAWPILIGLRPQESEWSIAALKFEANEGNDWVVSKVEPKLLSRGNEIFLDTINSNSRLFIRVDLSGNASAVDIYLSGMINGAPVAAKPANTIYRNFDSEE